MIGLIILMSFISAAVLYYQLLMLFSSGKDYMARLRRYTAPEGMYEEKMKKRRDSSSLLRDVL
ncbi:MAG TPA: hypothetical protein PK767_09930, partial [Clostridiales bacterium]|nr:hypothetical protein [Clostridiales bacterium]HPP36547.1 hypothetical protein [Clostridiales bacterium]